ncbi:39S ribosomal protein L13, mitochondrial, partial [Fragariocoptes setiger]
MLTPLRRVKQWQTFTRMWWLYDAKWQDPFDSGLLLARYLSGKRKPLWFPELDCGDHVVVINVSKIALPNEEWKWRKFLHHTGYAGGTNWKSAWELHQNDPTFILERAIYKNCSKGWKRKDEFARCMLFRGENVPDDVKANISGYIRQIRRVPKRLEEFSQEQLDAFPKIFEHGPQHKLD